MFVPFIGYLYLSFILPSHLLPSSPLTSVSLFGYLLLYLNSIEHISKYIQIQLETSTNRHYQHTIWIWPIRMYKFVGPNNLIAALVSASHHTKIIANEAIYEYAADKYRAPRMPYYITRCQNMQCRFPCKSRNECFPFIH